MQQRRWRPVGFGMAPALLALCAAPALADNPIGSAIGHLQSLSRLLQGGDGFQLLPATQGQFDSLSGDLMAALDPKSSGANRALGHGRLSLSISGDRTETRDPVLWAAASDEPREHFATPRLRLTAGLGDRVNLAVGAMRLPGSDATLLQAEASTRLLGEGESPTQLALRASVARLSGIDDLRVRTLGVEAIASHRLGDAGGYWLMPYAGAGVVRGDAQLRGDIPYESEQSLTKAFAGLELGGSGAWRLGGELGVTGSRQYQSVRIEYLF